MSSLHIEQARAIATHVEGDIFYGYSAKAMYGKICPAYLYANVSEVINAIIQAMDRSNDRDRELLAVALLDHRIEPFAGGVVLSFPQLAIDREDYGKLFYTHSLPDRSPE